MIGRTNAGLGGGGSGLNVTTGLSAPANPKENTIWVKSDNASKKFVFAVNTPTNPTEGLIWFFVTSAGIITRTQVYSGGTWVTVDTYMYLNGSWVRIAAGIAYILNGNDQVPQITGGWEGVRYYWSYSLPGGVPTVSWTTNGVSITASSEAAGSLLVTKNAIDVTQYKELVIDCTSASDQVMCQLSTGTKDQFKTGQAASITLAAGINTLDISALSGRYYVGIQPRAMKKTTIKSILLK